jgi:hypothetical protein
MRHYFFIILLGPAWPCSCSRIRPPRPDPRPKDQGTLDRLAGIVETMGQTVARLGDGFNQLTGSLKLANTAIDRLAAGQESLTS